MNENTEGAQGAGALGTQLVRMTGAELLKLYRRRGLIVWVAVLSVGGQVAFYTWGALQHAADPAHHAPTGGLRGLADAMMLLGYLGGVAAVMTGTVAGSGDTEAGVFRDLVSTGRSRLVLFAVRVPAALLVNGVFTVLAFTITAAGALLFADPAQAPSAALLGQCGTAALTTASVWTLLAVGLSSALSSRTVTVGLLLCWNLALGRVLEHAGGLGPLREGLSSAPVDRLVPAAVGGARVVPMPVWAAATVMLVWVGAGLAAGAWQTVRREA